MIVRLLWLLTTLGVIGAGGYTLWEVRKNQVGASLPTAPARSGEFVVIIRSRGELKARRSVQVFAPRNVPDLRINWLATNGDPVKEGDVVVRFDPSSARQQLQEREATPADIGKPLKDIATGIGVRLYRGGQPHGVWDEESASIAPGDMIVEIVRGAGN